MTQAAKWPAAIAALADFFGEHPNAPADELVLNTTINSTDLSIVATTSIPASWPATGRLIIDNEIIEYASYAGSTFTITNTSKRGMETAFGASAAASHTAGATIGNYLTAQAFAQVLAEIIAIQTQLGKNFHGTVYDNGNSGTAITIDWSRGDWQRVTLTGNCTFTFSNMVDGMRYTLELIQDATGSRTVTWPGAVVWSGGIAPTLTTTASKRDFIGFINRSSVPYGVASALNFS